MFCSAAAAASWPGLVWRSVGGGLEIPVNNTRHYERMEFCGIMYNVWYFIKRNCQEKLLKISKEEITIFINNLPLAVVCQCWVMRRRHCCSLALCMCSHFIWWNFSTILSSLLSTLHEWLIYLTWLILVSGLAPADIPPGPGRAKCLHHVMLSCAGGDWITGLASCFRGQLTGPRLWLWYNWNWRSWPAWLEVAIMARWSCQLCQTYNQTWNNKLKWLES